MLKRIKIEHRDFILNIADNSISKKNNEIKLTETECKILTLLLLAPKQVFSKEEILNYAWDQELNNNTSVVPQAISILRKKLYRDGIDAIDTVKGKGYKATPSRKRCLSKRKKKCGITIAILACTIATYGFYIQKPDEQPKIDQSLLKVDDNIYQTSNSAPIVVNPEILNEDVKYFIHVQKKAISLSACKITNQKCTSIYNKILFIDDENSKIDMNKLISDVSFKFDKPRGEPVFCNSNKHSSYKVSSSINLRALNNESYTGHVFVNYDVSQIETNHYKAELSAYVKESGYIGSFGYSVNLNAETKKITNQSNEHYISKISRDMKYSGIKSGRQQFGTIKDQSQLYAFPLMKNGTHSTYFNHIYPMGNGVNYVYMENANIGYLTFFYK
ncbi:transcriptional regulator [Aliivibrio fischeri]|uniref:winged helix-turn-helix domain-containing protein n=1 Tax=Aliivibrio fischeri TaxID=668 RepID=UPI00080E49DD|nr:winged helix-turn-helix domain-containing protein [Aliivibrio fischeri]OCH04379.1 transcriptional regulator [Aliivibrio fischeri]OCH32241.1 transcriptional regulator [Aliivibrio fischeri]